MDIAKLTEVDLNGVKTITRNPDINDIKMAYYAVASPYRDIFEKPKLWDGSKDIADFAYRKSIAKVHMMPQKPDAKTEWGYNPSPQMKAIADRLKSFFERLHKNVKTH